ncbi:MAG: hypothetical protein ACOH1Y_05050 [Propionicimonas sp.]
MAHSAAGPRSGPGPLWLDRVATGAIVLGGLSMAALFIPFTLAHGPTSFNEERLILGSDMLWWGLLLGVVPNLLISGGLWRLRKRTTGGRRASTMVLAIICVALLLDALANLALGGLGAPFVLFILVPSTLGLAVMAPTGGIEGVALRVLLSALGISLAAGVALALIEQEASDAFGGYRVYGIVVYGVGGVLWALIGACLSRGGFPEARA